ncbi:MAG: VWA domain-containing protein [Gammaproteobacteria bacterium]|nr:VWA domain-containing protein [Gammaproteobacteria bacterium]MCY4278841.1 VWA domain-containing protein [Gammaproteobacteria bacterium]MCY4323837.1 VWA domain-containing protein [Gammaproteobacteria bacterium]
MARPLASTASKQVDSFLSAAKKLPQTAAEAKITHRIMFALDATASRQPTWDMACALHAELFLAAREVSEMAVQLLFYRGLGELKKSPWVTSKQRLLELMQRVSCAGGLTQIGRLLREAAREASANPVKALIFIGDCFEEGEDEVLRIAGQLRLLNLPVIMLQEGNDVEATSAFSKIAKLSGGAHLPFASGSAEHLRRLLGAAVSFAVGGRRQLLRQDTSTARQFLSQLPRDGK